MNNARRMNLFTENNKLTLIFVVNYISKQIIEKADIVYFSKNTTDKKKKFVYFFLFIAYKK